METEKGLQDACEKTVYSTALLKVTNLDGDTDGFVNQSFCTDSKEKMLQNDVRSDSLDLTGNRDRNQYSDRDYNEIKSSGCDKSVASDLRSGISVADNGLAGSKKEENVEDKTVDYVTHKKIISIDDKEMFREIEFKNELSYQPVVSTETCKTNKHIKTENNSCESVVSHEPLGAEGIKEQKNKEKGNMSVHEMDIPPDDEETTCGIGRFRPKWLQKWATPKTYLILYSVFGVFQGSYFTYLTSIMSTIEKRFAFKSKISGVIMIIAEITPLVLGAPVGYFGGKAHRPRLVAVGLLLTSVCSLLSAMPFFIYGPGQHLVHSNSTGPEVCGFEQKMERCDEDDRPPTLPAVVLLILGSFCKGFGSLAYHVIGLSYMDDNTEKKKTPMYFGIMFAVELLGPTLGYLMSSAFLKIYENPFKDPGFDNEDPRWIGAWWMGFILQGILLFMFSFPMMMFPRRLPNQRKVQPLLQSNIEHKALLQKIKGLLVGLKRLSTNELYACLNIEADLSVLAGFGFYMMLPKYMENQFKLSASDSSLYSGPPGLVAIQAATILGGIIISKYRLSARAIMVGTTVSKILNVIFYLVMMIPACSNIHFGDSSLNAVRNSLELVNDCNRDCLCTTNVFTPLCDSDGVTTYFSSCHAGCSVTLPGENDGSEVFGNCSCIHGGSGTFVNVEKMTSGYCSDEDCWTQAKFYFSVLPVFAFVTHLFTVGHAMILLRSVAPEDKSFALGTFEAMLCLFGFIPAPLLFGALVDSACLIWEFSCGVMGNCWVYDMHKFKFILHGVCASLSFVALIFNFRILCISHKIGDLYKEVDGDDGDLEKQNEGDEKPCTLQSKDQDCLQSTIF